MKRENMTKTINTEKNLTEGKILKTMLMFAFPMISWEIFFSKFTILQTPW